MLETVVELQKSNLDTHIKVMESLLHLAKLKSGATPDNQTVKRLCKYFKVASVDELGRLMILEMRGYEDLHGDDISKECIIKESLLSPHLFYLVCDVFC